MLILIGLVDYYSPKPIIWDPTYEKNDSIPLGCKVFYDLIQKSRPQTEIRVNEEGYFINPNFDSLHNAAIVIITPFWDVSELDFESVLHSVKKGNDFFISAEKIPFWVMDSLHLEMNGFFDFQVSSNIELNFENPKLQTKSSFKCKTIQSYSSINISDSVDYTLLGSDQNKNKNFIKIPYGQGNFYFHSFPAAFSNYYLLKDSLYQYAFRAFSYIDKPLIIWDESYKPYKFYSTNPMTYISKQPALRIAWSVLVLTGILYMIFSGKRKQRIIPIIKPKPNTSLEFAQTVGRLYFARRNNKDIAMKKLQFFYFFLANNFKINAISYTDSFYTEVAEITGASYKEVWEILEQNRQLNNAQDISDDKLMNIVKNIETFKEKYS